MMTVMTSKQVLILKEKGGFLKLLLSRSFLGFIHFQRTDINMSVIPRLVDDTLNSLEKLRTQSVY